jgi:hypothetical protein
MQVRSAGTTLQLLIVPCSSLHRSPHAAQQRGGPPRQRAQPLDRRRHQRSVLSGMAAVAERLASAPQLDTAADQEVAIPALRHLALDAILALGFKLEDAECIVQVQHDIAAYLPHVAMACVHCWLSA